MSHRDILKLFMELFNFEKKDIREWMPYGNRAIRIKFSVPIKELPFTKGVVIFKFSSLNNWKLETVAAYCDEKDG